jgi:hypothetical protein
MSKKATRFFVPATNANTNHSSPLQQTHTQITPLPYNKRTHKSLHFPTTNAHTNHPTPLQQTHTQITPLPYNKRTHKSLHSRTNSHSLLAPVCNPLTDIVTSVLYL